MCAQSRQRLPARLAHKDAVIAIYEMVEKMPPEELKQKSLDFLTPLQVWGPLLSDAQQKQVERITGLVYAEVQKGSGKKKRHSSAASSSAGPAKMSKGRAAAQKVADTDVAEHSVRGAMRCCRM